MEPLIKIENVRFSYQNLDDPAKSTEVLKGISLAFERGELVAVLGQQ